MEWSWFLLVRSIGHDFSPTVLHWRRVYMESIRRDLYLFKVHTLNSSWFFKYWSDLECFFKTLSTKIGRSCSSLQNFGHFWRFLNFFCQKNMLHFLRNNFITHTEKSSSSKKKKTSHPSSHLACLNYWVKSLTLTAFVNTLRYIQDALTSYAEASHSEAIFCSLHRFLFYLRVQGVSYKNDDSLCSYFTGNYSFGGVHWCQWKLPNGDSSSSCENPC